MCVISSLQINLTQKEDLGFIMNPWSFFFIGYVFSQPLFVKSVYTVLKFLYVNVPSRKSLRL